MSLLKILANLLALSLQIALATLVLSLAGPALLGAAGMAAAGLWVLCAFCWLCIAAGYVGLAVVSAQAAMYLAFVWHLSKVHVMMGGPTVWEHAHEIFARGRAGASTFVRGAYDGSSSFTRSAVASSSAIVRGAYDGGSAIVRGAYTGSSTFVRGILIRPPSTGSVPDLAAGSVSDFATDLATSTTGSPTSDPATSNVAASSTTGYVSSSDPSFFTAGSSDPSTASSPSMGCGDSSSDGASSSTGPDRIEDDYEFQIPKRLRAGAARIKSIFRRPPPTPEVDAPRSHLNYTVEELNLGCGRKPAPA